MRQVKIMLSFIARVIVSACDIVSTAVSISLVHGAWPEAAIDCRTCAQSRFRQA